MRPGRRDVSARNPETVCRVRPQSSCIFWIIISLGVSLFHYRPQITAAAVVLIYDPYSSAINRDLYGATITFTLCNRGPPCISPPRTALPSAETQPVQIHNRRGFTHFICISSGGPLLYLLRNTAFILFARRYPLRPTVTRNSRFTDHSRARLMMMKKTQEAFFENLHFTATMPFTCAYKKMRKYAGTLHKCASSRFHVPAAFTASL